MSLLTLLLRRAPRRGRLGSVHTLPDFYSPELGNRRDILVHVPASYKRGDKRYPAIYMQDGQNLFHAETSFAGPWGLREALAHASRKGFEAIVVGIPNKGRERIDEYSPFVCPKNGGGKGDLYLQFVIRTLKPLIDESFRTVRDRSHTGIAGSSMGGLVSLYAFFRHPKVFGFTASLSPSLWFADSAIVRYLESAPFVSGRIYLDSGRMEGTQNLAIARHVRDILLAKGYRAGRDFRWVEDKRGRHQEAAWGRRFRKALPFLLSGE